MPEVLGGRESFHATEAVTDGEDTWITLLKEGVSENNRNYKRSTLEKAVNDHLYESMRMFVDHSDKPPLKRSVMELVSGISETKLDTSFPDGLARVRGKINWIDDDFRVRAEKAKAHMGVSHDAKLMGTRSRVGGRKYEDIDEISKVHSVDWVVYPSAGGGFEELYAREGVEMPDAIDWDAVDEEMLKKHKPDLYKALTDRAKESVADDDDEDDDEDDEDRSKESVKSKKTSTKPLNEDDVKRIVIDALESVQSRQGNQKQVADKIEDLVKRSTLPPLTKNRVIASFDGAEKFEEDKVKESIEDAKKELAAVGGPRVRNMGLTGNGTAKPGSTSLGRAHESVEEAFRIGMPAKKKDSKKDDNEEEK